jgi:hypothetical protein
VRLDSRLVGRKRWLHNATWPTSLLTVLALLPKEIVAMRRLGTHCDMRILLRPLL